MRPPLAAFKASNAPRTSEQEALLISSVPSLSAEARSPSDSAEAPVMAVIPRTPAKADDARIRRIFIFLPLCYRWKDVAGCHKYRSKLNPRCDACLSKWLKFIYMT